MGFKVLSNEVNYTDDGGSFDDQPVATLTVSSTYARDAAAAAVLAKAEREAAEAAKIAAETAETNAETAETNAETAETNAETAETNAAASATASANSATAGANSASAASTSESNASTSASTATTKATEAANSATSSATSATNASNSASTATTKATEASNSATSAASSLTSVQTIFDNFDDIYLGAKSSDPTVDNDGDPLNAGDVYWNSTASEVRFYNGTTWESPDAQAATSAAAALTSQNAAATSATNAATSATNASNSASTATTKASEASTSATAAETAETNAETAETNAETAETNAATSATSASNSATASANSATASASSASTATTKASEASTSASNAATSATASANSATASANSATAAATAETNAETAETNAETAETNAATSATASSNSATSAATSATTASTQATNAATSATTASTQATNAATSASTASTQATNSANSATAAETAETNAETAETNAETAETNAASSASASASSATSSANSATTATTKATEASTSASTATIKANEASSSATDAANSASSASASKDAALAALDNFDDRYLGQKASDPTVDNDGDALISGALYFNTTDDAMQVYDGSNWLSAYASLSGALLESNNLSDVASATTARSNLGLGTAATTAATAYATAAQGTKVDGIEANADVTDTTNVTAAGALMDSEVTNLAQVKAFDSSDYATAAQGTTADNALPKAGGTMTGDILYNDNVKAKFGAGSDLQIFHNASNSYITDAGQGKLIFSSNGQSVDVYDNANGHTMAQFTNNAGVTLSYQGATKIATTSTGIDVTGNATFADNGKAIFGAGSDLEIYSDGTHSYLKETGLGNLWLGGANIGLGNPTASEYFVQCVNNGEVKLYYDSAEKLATTAAGIDVTGTVTADGANIDGNLTVSSAYPRINLTDTDSNPDWSIINANGILNFYDVNNASNRVSVSTTGIDVTGTVTSDGLTVDGIVEISSTTPTLRFFETDQTDEGTILRSAGDSFQITKMLDTGAADGIRFGIDQSSGDISFYEDTGTTAKFFWDASSESLGIGTTTPTRMLEVYNTGSSMLAQFKSASGDDAFICFANNTSTADGVRVGSKGNDLVLSTYFTPRVTVKYAGNVGIGTSSPSGKLSIEGTTATGENSHITFENTAGAKKFAIGGGKSGVTNNGFAVVNVTDNTAPLFINDSGNVGIGTSSPAYALDVTGDKDTWISRLYNTGSDSSAQGLLVRSDATSAHDTPVLGVYADSGYKMMVRSTGNVGIGTSSPSSTLHIKTSVDNSVSQGLVIERSANTDKGYINYQGGAFQFRSTVGDPIVFGNTSNEQMRIDSSGALLLNPNNSTRGLKITTTQGEALGSDTTFDTIGAGYGKHIFKTDGTERMRIDSSGKVGIGVTSPDNKLCIASGSDSTGVGDGIAFYGAGSNKQAAIKSYNAGSYNGDLRFYTVNKGQIDTNVSEAMRIDSSGNLLVGRPSTLNNAQTSIKGASGKQVLTLQTTTDSNSLIQGYNSSTALAFQVRGDGDVYISGDLGIGTSSPSAALHVESSAAQSGRSLRLAYDGSYYTEIASKASGGVSYNSVNATAGGHRFEIDGSEKMRIDSSGNVLVGKTTTSIGTQGTLIKASGRIEVAKTNDTPLFLNRLSGDGEIVALKKDGTTVGSIGNNSGGLYIGSGDAGITMESTLDAIIPTNTSSGSYTDNALDIGYSTKRFKDLHLSGTVNASTVDLGNWTVTESNGSIYFATGGVNKMKLDASGNLDVVGNVNSNATIT
jgi:hypothetical protein